MYRRFLLVALLSFCTIAPGAAELQPSSALERTQCKFPDHTDVTVEYVSMQRSGRTIFGGVVPYGRVWEMGKKRLPTFVTGANLLVGGKNVPAGHYSLSMIPNPDTWTMVVKKMTGKGNPNGMDEIARIDLTVRRLPSPLESFTISFDQLPGGCVLKLRWEETEASALLAEKK